VSPEERIEKALELAAWGTVDGDHHKMWLIDQIVRALTDCPIVSIKSRYRNAQGDEYFYEGYGESPAYLAFVAEHEDGEDGPGTYEWDTGVAP